MKSLVDVAAIGIAIGIFATIAAAETPPGPTAEEERIAGPLYSERCASCHGETLKGGNLAPAIVGARFQDAWAGKPARELYNRIITTMPKSDPGSLEPGQVVALTVFIAAQNNIKIVAVTPDDLKSIQLDAPTH